jgi:hypothetical protein
MLVMPDHIIQCHLFAARSNFCVGAEEEDESEDEIERDSEASGDSTSCNPMMRPYNTERNELSQQTPVPDGSDNNYDDENNGDPTVLVVGTEQLGANPRAPIFDKPQSFIVPDESNAGPLVVFATKKMIPSRRSRRFSSCRNTVRAIAVRIQQFAGYKEVRSGNKMYLLRATCIGFSPELLAFYSKRRAVHCNTFFTSRARARDRRFEMDG